MIKTVFQIVFLNLIALLIISCSNPSEPSSNGATDFNLLADIKVICKKIPKKYAYFETRAAHWPETCERAKKEALLLDGRKGALAVLERMVDDLYDPHIGLNTNNQDSPRLIPSGADLWVEILDDRPVVTAIRPLSGAAEAGIEIGDELVSFNEIAPRALALTRIHSGRDSIGENRFTWAINAAIAGRRSDPRNIKLKRNEEILSFSLGSPEVTLPDDPIFYKIVSDRIGYISFNNSLGESSTVPAFDAALNALRQTDSLIIDLRHTPGGGNTSVAEPILGRFIEKKMAYQATVFRNGFVKNRYIKPSGKWTYDKPIIILVGRWTGSMGEGMAIGFDGMGRGTIMGNQMARLAGGTNGIKLKETGVTLKFPTYDLHHLNGTPRHEWEPSETVLADNGAQQDILLKRAISVLQGK